MLPPRETSRRSFLTQAASAAAASIALPALAQSRTKVVVVTCADAIKENDAANVGAVRRMVDKGITTLAGKSDVQAAWKSFVRSGDNVALVDSGTWLLNVPAVPAEVARGLRLASPKGITFAYCKLAERKTAYMDSLRSELTRCGVPRETMRGDIYTIPCTFHQQGYDLIVMTPTLKNHSIAGVSGVVKHYATMSKTHVRNFHANGMETAGQVLGQEFNKHRHLVIVDGLRWGAMQSGPAYYQKALLFGTDPVAVDMVALQMFLEHLETGKAIPPDRHRILADTRYGAGISDLKRIDIVKVKV